MIHNSDVHTFQKKVSIRSETIVISIRFPTLNAIHFLQERMDSIFSQTHSHWEFVVCDSYSDDGTWEYLQTFADALAPACIKCPKRGSTLAGMSVCGGMLECLSTSQWQVDLPSLRSFES